MSVKSGFIYILTHPSDSNLIKVGMTTRHPNIRLKEHNTQLDKAAGEVVKATGQEWILNKFFKVEDTYNAESAFFQRAPFTEIPGALANELIKLDGKHITWEWVQEGLEVAKSIGVRKNTSQPPNQKPKSTKGLQGVEAQLEGSGLNPIDGCGNGITKVAFECSKGHIFKISGRSLIRFPYCPVCNPERFDTYTFRRIEICKS